MRPRKPVCVLEGRVLREMRDKLGWSQREAAATAGVSPSTWSRWESGYNFAPAHVHRMMITRLERGSAHREGR